MNELQNHNPAIVGSVSHKEFSFFCIQLLLVGIYSLAECQQHQHLHPVMSLSHLSQTVFS